MCGVFCMNKDAVGLSLEKLVVSQSGHSTPFMEPEYTELILPVVLYGCGTWSLTLRDEHRLCVCVTLGCSEG